MILRLNETSLMVEGGSSSFKDVLNGHIITILFRKLTYREKEKKRVQKYTKLKEKEPVSCTNIINERIKSNILT